MRTILAAVVTLLALGSTPAFAGFDGDADIYIGWRGLQDGDLWNNSAAVLNADFRDQTAFGLAANFGASDFPINGEIGWGVSARQRDFTDGFGDDHRETISVADVYIGPLWRPVKTGPVQPYVGFGLASVNAKIDDRDRTADITFSDNDSSSGVYAHAGLKVLVARHVNLGVDFRALRGTHVQLFGVDGNANYNQVTFRVGYSWGDGPAEPHHHPRPMREPRLRSHSSDRLSPSDTPVVGF